jgi:hypothetical protein
LLFGFIIGRGFIACDDKEVKRLETQDKETREGFRCEDSIAIYRDVSGLVGLEAKNPAVAT